MTDVNTDEPHFVNQMQINGEKLTKSVPSPPTVNTYIRGVFDRFKSGRQKFFFQLCHDALRLVL